MARRQDGRAEGRVALLRDSADRVALPRVSKAPRVPEDLAESTPEVPEDLAPRVIERRSPTARRKIGVHRQPEPRKAGGIRDLPALRSRMRDPRKDAAVLTPDRAARAGRRQPAPEALVVRPVRESRWAPTVAGAVSPRGCRAPRRSSPDWIAMATGNFRGRSFPKG
jgi:hypothetical protein